MKKRSVIIACAAAMTMLILVSCSTREPQHFKMELKENATTGYVWSYEIADDAIVKISKDETVGGDRNKAGAPSTRILEFSGIKEGETTITFTYKRNWEGGDTAKTKEVTVTVDQEGNVQSK